MNVTDCMSTYGHEELVVWSDPSVGLRAFVAIHDTTLGPACGGVRIWPHRTEEDAVMDVLRLSRAMTYKSAAAGLPLGGGKGLIWADPRKDKTEGMFRSYGRLIESLNGRYITTEDVGATVQDIEWIASETTHVVGLPLARGGSGNPATVTGFGLYQAMRACSRAAWGSDSLDGKTIAMQGFGNVAAALTPHLVKAGARLLLTDTNDAARQRAGAVPGARVVEPDAIYDVQCDIFAPCALGGVLNELTIPRLRCAVVCGAANNQLADDADAARLAGRGILYAPDYIVNAGGIINVSYEMGRPYNADAAMAKAAQIGETTAHIIAMAKERGITTARAADQLAEERLSAARKARHIR